MNKKQKKLTKVIDECVVNDFERMKTLKTEDRFHLLLEMGAWMYNHLSEEVDSVLIVPSFKEE